MRKKFDVLSAKGSGVYAECIQEVHSAIQNTEGTGFWKDEAKLKWQCPDMTAGSDALMRRLLAAAR